MASSGAPRSLLIKPASGDCNLHCAYCFYHDRANDPYAAQPVRRMTPAVLDAVIRQGMALDRHQATFGWQGGEPTLCGLDFFRQAVTLQKRYGASGQAVSNGLQTNALLLDAEWARFLAEYRFLLGVSLDGPAELHDHYRRYAQGGPTHARVRERLELLRTHRVECNILTVVNAATVRHGAAIYDYLVGEGFQYLQFIPCVESDPQTGRPIEFSVQPEAFGDFLCQVFDRWYNGGAPQVSVRDFEATLAIYLGMESPMCCYQERCGGYLVVEHNGDLYPCDFYVREDLRLGNVQTLGLERAFAGAELGAFATRKAAPRAECQACAWLALCHQGCPRMVGVSGARSHYLCRAYQQFFAHSQAAFMTLRDAWLAQQDRTARTTLPNPVRTVGRNDPCPCGSGKKFKQCCGRLAAPVSQAGAGKRNP